MKTVIKHNFSYQLILALLFSAAAGALVSLALSALVMIMPTEPGNVADASSATTQFIGADRFSIKRNKMLVDPAVFISGKATVLEMDI